MAKRRNFLIAGGLIVIAVVFLIITSTNSSASYYMTIEELLDMRDDDGRQVTVSGAVIGSSITYDTSIPRVEFTIVQIPGDQAEIDEDGGLAEVLHEAVTNPVGKETLHVVYDNVKPDLLKDEAQAIVRGHLEGMVFVADELLLKCPSRYAEEIPEQIMEEE